MHLKLTSIFGCTVFPISLLYLPVDGLVQMSILGLPNEYFLDKAVAEDILLMVVQFHKQDFPQLIPSPSVDFIAPHFLIKDLEN